MLSIEEIRRYFAGANGSYVCEQMEQGHDFDYVLYFPDREQDIYKKGS